MRISIVCNDGGGKKISDGGSVKGRTLVKTFQMLGHDIQIIDVCAWKTKPFSIINKFRKALLKRDVVIITLAENGSKMFSRLASFFKKKAKLIMCPVGLGSLATTLHEVPWDKKFDFLNCRDFSGFKDKTMSRLLKKFDGVLVENQMVKNVYDAFYGLNNVSVLDNYRLSFDDSPHSEFSKDHLRLVFFSRVSSVKGILNLVDCVSSLNDEGAQIELDIYGKNELTEEENLHFQSKLSDKIRYCKVGDFHKSGSILSQYDIHCLPTLSHYEGTPGALIEAALAGTPSLCSSIPQAKEYIDDGKDGFIYKFGDTEELKNKLRYINAHLELLPAMHEILLKKRKRYTLDGNLETINRLFFLTE